VNKRPPRNGEIVQKIQNTLLIDGNSLFKVGYHGAKDEYNRNGKHVGGLYQFITMLRKMLVEDLYHRVYVFWDGDFSGKLRYDIYKPYKIARGKDYENGTHPIDESELEQRKLIWEYINEMYIRQLMNEVVEGDDFIGYYCLTKKQNEKITIVSNDRDMAQLISEDVKIYFLDLKVYVDLNNYSDYFNHHQENSVLIKTIRGDISDSIKGIKGVGEKTLLTLFPEIKERKLTINEIIDGAKKQKLERIEKKQPPLKVLDSIINSITNGVQGDRLYEINDKLVNLKKPLMTEEAIRDLEDLKNGTLDSSGRDIKNVLMMMERDGLDKIIGDYRYNEYLIPFKKLIGRE